MTLSGYYFAADVILISAEPLAASFTSLTIESSSHLVLDGIAVNHILQQGEPDWTAGFRIEDADHITIRNAEISGSADGVATNDGEGLVILNSSTILVEATLFHDLKYGASISRSDGIIVKDSTFTEIRSDGVRIANARNVAIDSNTFTNFRPAYELGDHPDMIQVWNSGRNGDMSGITITNNTLSKGDGEDVQAIFIQGALPDTQGNLPAMAHDIVVSGNTVETGVLQGIWLQDVAGAIIADNVVTQSAGGVQSPTIRMDGTVNSTVIGNIAPVIQDFGSTNLIVGENTLTALTHVTGTAGADTLEGTVAPTASLARWAATWLTVMMATTRCSAVTVMTLSTAERATTS